MSFITFLEIRVEVSSCSNYINLTYALEYQRQIHEFVHIIHNSSLSYAT
jgi:hypothetical protein